MIATLRIGLFQGITVVAVTLLVFALDGVCAGSSPQVAGGKNGKALEKRYAPGELLVKYRSRGGFRDAGDQGRPHPWRGGLVRELKAMGIHRVGVREGLTVEDALEACRQDPAVEYAEPNYVRRLVAVPNDPGFQDLWGLDNTGQSGGRFDADIDAPEAWDMQTGRYEVIVAVLDTGADLDHEDLFNNIVAGYDFVNDDVEPDDDNAGTYHGTHVSGTIGAEGDNGKGVAGVNWSVSIMPLKILAADGTGLVSDEIEAIDYAISRGAKIINASYSGGDYSYAEYDAIKRARNAGVLFVVAAGNDGRDITAMPAYPAAYDLDNIIAVAATDTFDELASFSNFGATTVHLAAPGVDIFSTSVGDAYRLSSGTSMATPHVAGLAALIWAEDFVADGRFTLTYRQVKERIFNGVDVLPSLSARMLMAGRINAYNSIEGLYPGDEPNEAPAGLAAASLSARRVRLTWVDNASNESGFKVRRAAASGGSFVHVGTAGRNSPSFTDATARDGSTNYYTVVAFNTYGESGPSDEAQATTPLAAPTDCLAVVLTGGAIRVTWQDNSVVESGYAVEEKEDGGAFRVVALVGSDVESHTRSGLEPSETYTYRVRTMDSSGNISNALSNESRAQPVAAATDTQSSGTTRSSSGGGGGGGCFISVAGDKGACRF